MSLESGLGLFALKPTVKASLKLNKRSREFGRPMSTINQAWIKRLGEFTYHQGSLVRSCGKSSESVNEPRVSSKFGDRGCRYKQVKAQ